MRSGAQTAYCTIMRWSGTGLDSYGKPKPSSLVEWRTAWGRIRTLTPRETIQTAETISNQAAQFFFDYLDAMAPDPEGTKLDETMVIRAEDDFGTDLGWFDIAGISPDPGMQEVRVDAVKRKVPV